MYHKIFVPLDGSSLSELALPHAIALAQCFAAEVLLSRVCEPVSIPFELYPALPSLAYDYAQDLQKQAQAEIDGYLKQIQNKLLLVKVKSSCFAREGFVTEAILDIVEKEKVDLIIMSTHGRSGLSRWVYGSVAAKILQAAHCPVFLVRANHPS